MSFKDGRIGVGKDPIFPLDISGSCRIDGDLILGGRFSDSQGNAIQLGSGSGATSTPDQNQNGLPSWSSGTISTQGLGIFKGRLDTAKKLTLITGDSGWNTSTSGTNNTSCGYASGMSLQGGTNNSFFGSYAGVNVNTGGANTCMGFESGKNITSAAYNTFIGSECGKGSWPTTGDYNTCVGDRSGYSITSGTHNTIIGRAAGYWTSTASHNTFLGYYAGYNNSTGAENVVIGSEAGKALNTGTRNTILGFEAGKVLTSSGSNVIIGARAGYNSTGTDNTFVGTYAGNKNTSGGQNTSVGKSAGYNLTTGSGNTIMGYQAGYSNTTGTYNVFIGESCGYNHTTPSYNTFIGYRVAMNNNNNTGCNVFIGKNTAYYNNGCFNVALGKEALMGYMNQAATRSGDANVAIGYQAAWRHDGHGNVIIGPYSGNQSTTITPSSIHDNVCVGIYTGTKLKNSKGNVFIGPYAGQNFSRTTSMDGYNTFVGYYAGKGTTTGTYNVAMGAHALENHTTGGENVAIGKSAGMRITSAADNICIGAYSGESITTGNGNVCLGWDAGGDITTGYDNIAIGRYCCREGAVTGGYNIMMGYFAGHPLTSGSSNVGIGNHALRNINTGNHNTCVGISCGRELTTGTNNTFYGNAAGYKNTTGYQNIAIGYNANYYETTGYNNIAIGHHAGCPNGGHNDSYKLFINTHAGYYGENSFIYGHGKMTDNPYLVLNARMVIGGKTFDRSDTRLELKDGNLLVRADGTNVDGVILIRGGGGHTSYFYTLYNGNCLINSYARYAPILLNSGSGREGYRIGMYDTAPTDPDMNDSTLGNPYGKLYVQGGHVGTEPSVNTDVQSAAIVIGAHGGSTWNTNAYGGFLAFTQPYWSGNTTQQVPGGWIACKKSIGNGSYGWGMAFGTTANHGNDYDEKMLLTQSGWLSIDGTYQSSDDRIKHNETTIENPLETLNQLKGKVYFKTHEMYEPNHNFNLDINGEPIDESGNLIDYTMESGFIAQSVLKIDKLKHLVTGGDEYVEETTIKEDLSGNPILDSSGNTIIDEVKTVFYKKRYILNYCGIIPWNTEGIKELYKENKELKARLAKLEAFLGI